MLLPVLQTMFPRDQLPPEIAAVFGNGAKIQAALDKAAAVWARQEAHELLCTERWGQVRKSLEELHAAFSASYDRTSASVRSLWWLVLVCAGGLICGMAGLIVTLVFRGHFG